MAESDEDVIAIIDAVDSKRKRAETKALDVSLNELMAMYESNELTIRPEYQRLFRWDTAKQSQFIESLVLEMPVPPIFMIELEEGKWELIDGLQRISTFLHFRGQLAAPECDPPIKVGDSLELQDCDIVTELNGMTFDDLPTAIQIRLKRSFLRVELVRSGTDSRFRYYMFKRLNTGGEILSDQEVRNCTIRLLGDDFNEYLITLSRNEAFQSCIESLSNDKRQQMIEVELVLRFFAFHVNFEQFKHDVGPFLTDFMERVTDQDSDGAIPFDYSLNEMTFKRTFGLLAATLGSNTCQRWIAASQRFGGGFSNHHFEAFSLGVARVIDGVDDSDAPLARVGIALDEIKKNAEFQSLTTGGGKNSPGPYNDKIAFVANRVRAELSS